MAPEYRDLLNNCETSDFTTAVDMWSFGCLIYELFAQRCPFDETDNQALMKYVRSGTFPRQPLDDCGASSESVWLITSLLEREPQLRLSAHEALGSAWLDTTALAASETPPQTRPLLKAAESEPIPSTKASSISAAQLNSTQASLNAGFDLPASAPPELVVVLDETQADSETSVAPSIGSLAKPALAERAVTRLEATYAPISVDDSALLISKTSQGPEVPPRPKSSNTLRQDFVQDVKNLQLADAPIQAYSVSFPDEDQNSNKANARSMHIARKPLTKQAATQPLPFPEMHPA